MSLYDPDILHYQAVDMEGRSVEGHLDGSDPADAIRRLRDAGLTPVRVGRTPIRSSIWSREIVFFGRRKLSVAICLEFCRSLAVILRSGVTLVEALRLLEGSSDYSGSLRSFVSAAQREIRLGQSLSRAVLASGFNLPRDFVATIAAGEQSGNLVASLERLQHAYERQLTVGRSVVSALAYPAFLVATCVAVILVLAFFVAPNLVQLFTSAGKESPTVIWLLSTIADVAYENLALLVMLLGLIVLSLVVVLTRQDGRMAIRTCLRFLPVLGAMLAWSATGRFASTFRLCIESNVPVERGLAVAIDACGMVPAAASAKMLEDVRHGRSVSAALAGARLFPQKFVDLIRVGEGSGSLSDVLRSAEDEATNRFSSSVSLISSVLAPTLILMVGTFAGSIIFSVFSALLQISELAR